MKWVLSDPYSYSLWHLWQTSRNNTSELNPTGPDCASKVKRHVAYILGQHPLSTLTYRTVESSQDQSRGQENSDLLGGGSILPDIKNYFQAIVTNTVSQYKNRKIDQLGKTDSLERGLYLHGYLIDDRGDITNQCEKDGIINNGIGTTGHPYCNKFRYTPHTQTQMNPR